MTDSSKRLLIYYQALLNGEGNNYDKKLEYIAALEIKKEKRKEKEDYSKNVILKELIFKIERASLSNVSINALTNAPVYNDSDAYKSALDYAELIKSYQADYVVIKGVPF